MQARCERDKGYSNYLAAQDLVQGCGRVQRSEDDLGVSLILDDQISWFAKTAEESIPKWFRVRKEEKLPKPLRKL
jgi:Rad3-related DNA helicase